MSHRTLAPITLDRSHWYLDPHLTFLNHGSFGACPREIIDHQRQLQQQLEFSPVAFYLRHMAPLFEHAQIELTQLLSCQPQEVVLVGNTSEGVSTVLRSIDWQTGDEIVVSNHAYPACRHMLSVLREQKGIVVRIAYTTFAHLDHFHHQQRAHTQYTEIVNAYESQMSTRTRCLLIEHISSPTAICFPVKELIDLAKRYGVLSIVDAAHALGHVEINLQELKPDFYISNAHKWLFTPKSCAFLYIAPQHHDWIYPLVVSHGYTHKINQQSSTACVQALFAWTGTRDYSPYLSIPSTLQWIRTHCGSVSNLIESNQLKLQQARQQILAAWWGDNEVAQLCLPSTHSLASMCTIPLPPLNHIPSKAKELSIAGQIHPVQEYLYEHQIEVPIIEWQGGVDPDLTSSLFTESMTDHLELSESKLSSIVCVRISAQLYNTPKDYQHLIQVINDIRQ
jgi:isopenicillin-N epimerase